jgi:glycosyltransferase involved in cell wall biosynthesis
MAALQLNSTKMVAGDPIIDVVLPVYNAASTIRESVNSIRAQTLENIRIIIVDDGSTDHTPRVLAELANLDNRIHLLQKPNGGVVETLNLALQYCGAEFVARQDADDISDPIRLERQYDYLKVHKDCVAVSCGARHIDVDGTPTGHVTFGSLGELANPYSMYATEFYLLHPFLMVRRSLLRKAGNYRFVYHSEDTDLYWRLSELGSLHIDDIVLGSYRMHDQSISGGSILNGRIMAVSSQLAALSARRRTANRPDIPFRKEAINEYRKAQSLRGICNVAQRDLDAHEAAYLRIASSAKLLDLAAYRPYNIERQDAHFIREAYVQNKIYSPDQLSGFRFLISTTAARLIKNGMLNDAITLIPPSLAGEVIFRLFAPYLTESLHRVSASFGKKISNMLFKVKKPS